ncbi:hypothetical protein ACFX2B_046075 [Malus domestica]
MVSTGFPHGDEALLQLQGVTCNGFHHLQTESRAFLQWWAHEIPTEHQLGSTDKASTTSTLLVRHYPTICQPTIPLSKPQKISLLLLQDAGHTFLKQDCFKFFYYYTYSSNISVEVGLPWKPMVKLEEARFSACLSPAHDNGCTGRDNHSRWAIFGFP